jgi:integrase
MARKPSVNWWESRKAFGTTFKGHQVILAKGEKDDSPPGPVYLAALAKFRELLALDGAEKQGEQVLVFAVCELYARHLEAQCRLKTLKMFQDCLKSGVERLAVKFLKGALNWAVGQGYFKHHCLQQRGVLALPRGRSRGREAFLTPEEVALLTNNANQRLRSVILFLAGTGCRPGEAYHLEAKHYHRDQGCIIFPHNPAEGEWTHKTAAKTEKDRVILLTPPMVELIEKFVAEHPTGPLFRNKYGKRWTDNTAAMAIRTLAGQVGVKKGVQMSSFRHTFASRWLLQGGSIKVLADVLGTSVAMIEKHYGHIDVERGQLRALVCKLMCPTEAS